MLSGRHGRPTHTCTHPMSFFRSEPPFRLFFVQGNACLRFYVVQCNRALAVINDLLDSRILECTSMSVHCRDAKLYLNASASDVAQGLKVSV